MKKILAVVAVVLLVASTSYAKSVFEVLKSAVTATTSGVTKTVSNANPGKVISDTAEDTVATTQKAGEVTVGAAKNTAGVVSQAVSNK